MSSFVCSDHTILAIVEGMRKYGMIAKKKAESRDMAEALRLINEYQTTKRYMASGTVKRWTVEQDHIAVTAAPRKYTDGETLVAINCYLYQIDDTPLHDFDFITLVASVKILRDKIQKLETIRHTAGGWQEYDTEADDWADIYDKYGWDLAA